MDQINISKLPDEIVEEMGIREWPVWEKEVSRFDWEYDGDEQCLVLEGLVEVETDSGTYVIKEGDFVTFKKGLKCVWDVKTPVRKHYNFP